MTTFRYQNFYIKTVVEMLAHPLPLVAFLKPDTIDEYYTIPEYLATMNQTVERYSNDGVYFLKGFGFNIASLDELRSKLVDFNLTEGVNFFILSHPEALEELAKPEWDNNELPVA